MRRKVPASRDGVGPTASPFASPPSSPVADKPNDKSLPEQPSLKAARVHEDKRADEDEGDEQTARRRADTRSVPRVGRASESSAPTTSSGPSVAETKPEPEFSRNAATAASSRTAVAEPPLRRPDEEVSTIAPDTIIRGTFKTGSPLILSGTVDGSVESGADVTVLASAKVQGTVSGIQIEVHGDGLVHGDIIGREVQIAGKVTGQVHAAGKLLIRSSGTVEGDVNVRALVVEDGGTLRGACRMGSAAEAS